MKNIKKISNYSLAGILAVGVLLLSLFAYNQRIQADTILPGYATAHLNIHVTVPEIQTVPFKVTLLPLSNNSGIYYFKERTFTLTGAGLNTIEWYIRKLPAGKFKVVLESNGKELTGSPYEATLQIDKVSDTTSFDLFIGEPTPAPVIMPTQQNAELPDPNYEEGESPIPDEEIIPDEDLLPDEEIEGSNNENSTDSPPAPGELADEEETEGPF